MKFSHNNNYMLMSQEKLKTVRMQNFGGQTRCIMGDVKMANSFSVT